MSEFELSRMFIALLCLLGAAHAFGYACVQLRMPRVIGEIMGGLLLGPSLLGFFLPDFQNSIFHAFPAEKQVLSAFYWIGLIALMFISGFRIQRRLDRKDASLAGIIILAATGLPFLAGWVAPHLFEFAPYAGPNGDGLPLTLIIAIAFSVTSIPVISKIFLDLQIIETRFARIVLAAATTQDLILWIGLSVATGIAHGNAADPVTLATTILKTLMFIGLALVFGPRLLDRATRMRFNLIRKASLTGYLFVICFLLVAIANLLSINLVFGALVAGMVVGAVPNEEFTAVKEQISNISTGLFVPIYFALVGLRIDLPNHLDIGFTAGFITISSLIEIGCVVIATRLTGRNMLTSLNFGFAMNTRGGPGIVLASIALGAGIINETFYVTLVLAALVTSLFSGMWFRWLLTRGLPLIESDKPPRLLEREPPASRKG
ncbi:cation:proton antiporter [Alphaproteobacteria bacterium HT1-32]|nr:cation:proton antiporter [Alphaproteobacteria bacterium HT1-32]